MDNSNKKYTCVVRTYIMDLIEIGSLTEDYYHTYECSKKGVDSSLTLGNDVMEMDYFDNEKVLAKNEDKDLYLVSNY